MNYKLTLVEQSYPPARQLSSPTGMLAVEESDTDSYQENGSNFYRPHPPQQQPKYNTLQKEGIHSKVTLIALIIEDKIEKKFMMESCLEKVNIVTKAD